MPRDSQRAKVYESERAADLVNNRLETTREIQAWVDSITRSRWWKSKTNIIHIYVWSGKGCRNALSGWDLRCKRARPFIKMPPWSRSKATILHELVHHLISDSCAAHGREFCNVYLKAIRRWLGYDEWRKLHHEFHNLKVKHHKAPCLGRERRLQLSLAAKERFGKENND